MCPILCDVCRSYGVLVWEMVSYGAVPLPGLSSREIAECAQNGTLHHVMSVNSTISYAVYVLSNLSCKSICFSLTLSLTLSLCLSLTHSLTHSPHTYTHTPYNTHTTVQQAVVLCCLPSYLSAIITTLF